MPGTRTTNKNQIRRRRTTKALREVQADLPMLRSSERATFKRCRWLWWHEYEERIKPITATPPLRFGNLIHLALAAYYKPGRRRGPKPWITFEKVYEAERREVESFGFRVDDDETWVEAGELGDSMLRNYVEHYTSGLAKLPDEEFEVLVTEQPFRVLVYRPNTDGHHYKQPVPWFWYTGIVDGIWKHLPTKRLHIVDHKTAAAIQPKYLSMDPQATSYWTFGLDWIYEQGLLKPNQKPGGMLFNILRKAAPDDRLKDKDGYYLNQDGSVSKRQPAPMFARIPIYRDFNERENLREQVLYEFNDMEAVRLAGLNFGSYETKEPPPEAYKNPSAWTCAGCWLFDASELHDIGQDWRGYIEMTTQPWLPYEQHEIEMAERK